MLLATFLLLFLLPLAAACVVPLRDPAVPWYEARRDASGLAPDPETTREAVIQVYGARTVGWRGVFGVHTWIAVKPEGASRFTRYEVMGWGVERGIKAVRIDRSGPDNWWFGAEPTLLLDKRGPEAQELIPRVREAVASYPWPDFYRLWPGPNSNTFTAHVAREVPELGLVLPPTAIGKDYFGGIAALAPSGTGVQLSAWGAAGVTLAVEEGVEVNFLGLVVGLDVVRPAVKLPGLGRIGIERRG
jgi:hypothetical protein